MPDFLLFPAAAPLDFSSLPAFKHIAPETLARVDVLYGLLFAAGLLIDFVLLAKWSLRRGPWTREFNRLAWRPWCASDVRPIVTWVVFLFLVIAFAQAASLRRADAPPAGITPFWLVMQSLCMHGAGLVVIALSMARRRLSWKEGFGLQVRGWPNRLLQGLVLYLGALPAVAILGVAYQFLLQRLGHEFDFQPVARSLAQPQSFWMQLYSWSFAIGVAPFFEEIFFRGILLPCMVKRAGVWRGVFLVSLLFAAIHFHVPSMAPLFAIAVACSIGYLYSGSILVPIFMHVLFNAVNIGILTYITRAGS